MSDPTILPTSRFSPWYKSKWIWLIPVLLVTLLVYWPGRTGGWIFDDYPNIVENTVLHLTAWPQSLGAWLNIALSSPSSFTHRPLASITFALNWLQAGGNPYPFKMTNILIHLLNGVALFGMLGVLFRLMGLKDERWLGALGGRVRLGVTAAWLLLPINLMAVLYVVQRMESLSQLFVLLGLWAYLAGRLRMLTGRLKRGFSLAAAGIVLGTLLGVTAKETAVLLPAIAFLAEWVLLGFKRDLRPETSQSKSLWTLFTVTLILPGILGTAWLLKHTLPTVNWVGRDFTLGQRLLTEPRVLMDYIGWSLFPSPATLSLYHDNFVKSLSLISPPTTLVAILCLAFLLGLGIWLRHRRPLVALGILWFFAGNLLTATFIPLELVFEQRMYLPSVGLLLALGAWLFSTTRLKVRWQVLIAVLFLLWFGLVTNIRATSWSNPVRLAVTEANLHPTSPRAVYDAGRVLLIASQYQQGKFMDDAQHYLELAVALPGASALPAQALIMLTDRHHQGDDAEWWRALDKSLDKPITQSDISALISLVACYRQGFCVFQPSNLQHAFLLALHHPKPISRLWGAYATFQWKIMNNLSEATKDLALAVQGDASQPAYRLDLADLYILQGEKGKAEKQIVILKKQDLAGRLAPEIQILENKLDVSP